MSKLSSTLQISPQDLFVVSTVAQADLGALAHTADGRKFRYALAGAVALTAGTLQQSPVETTGWQNLTAVAASIGDTSISASTTITVTANALSQGYALITVTPGVGQVYQIAANAAFTAAAPTISLSDPVRVALTTSSKIDLVAHPYNGTIINPATATGLPVGVAMTAVAAASYCWLQVGGVANVLADGAITVGTNVIASNATAGAVEPGADAADLQASVGVAMTGISTTEYGAVKITGLD